MNIKRSKISFLAILMVLGFLGCSPDTEEPSDPKSGNLQLLGTSARDLLSDEDYSSLIIEVAFVQDFEPSAAALEELKGFLQTYTNKPDGLSIVKTAVEVPDNGPYSISKVADIEKKFRTQFNEGNRLAVFIFFANGISTKDLEEESKENDLVTLGSAYRNTSMVLYEPTLRNTALEKGVSKTDITSATLQHEFGHLFGLVDNGTPAQSDHLDPEYKAHCNVSGCLMSALVEFGSGAAKYVKTRNKSTHAFDAKCREDMIANGGKS